MEDRVQAVRRMRCPQHLAFVHRARRYAPVMLDPNPEQESQGEARTPSGLTPFLVDPADPHATVEALRGAVRALIRERDYLREVRDVQLAEHEVDLSQQQERVDELRSVLEAMRADRDDWKKRAESLHEGLAAQRVQVLHYVHELAAQRLRTAALLQEVAAVVSGEGAARATARRARPESA